MAACSPARLLLLCAAPVGCAAETPASDLIRWGGYVYQDVYISSDLLVDGPIELLDPDGACIEDDDGACMLAEASTSTEGYWSFVVEKDRPLALRVSGAGLAPTVWRSDAPGRSAQWQSGALFARDLASLDAFALELDPPGGSPTSLATADGAWLWGAPLDPADWAGATLDLLGGDGQPADLLAYSVDESGALRPRTDGPIDLFLAFDLAPGVVVLTVQTPDGRQMTETWPARAGDLLAGNFLALPAN